MPICPYKSNARTKIWMIRISSRVVRKWWDVDENWLESYRAWTAGESLILHIAFFCKKNISKTSYCDTIKLKNTCEFNGHPNTTHSHTQGLHPYGSTSATTLSVVALRHYESNTGQITMNKKVKNIHERRDFTNLDNMYSLGSSFIIRVLSWHW